ncbi:unnamed protein product [Vicia faba]|uniref:Uncharacterized protein n=1 Tax=Vicia faba TaxID=3906 RepID=A0AAV1AUC4_VICFA|nr:unnamed protein product [Vicia faba]
MAGLQQYNFFPTDLFYPRPQPQQSTPIVLPLQTPNTQDHSQNHQQQQSSSTMMKPTPSTSSLICTHKTQSFDVVDNSKSKLSPNPLSFMVWIDEE